MSDWLNEIRHQMGKKQKNKIKKGRGRSVVIIFVLPSHYSAMASNFVPVLSIYLTLVKFATEVSGSSTRYCNINKLLTSYLSKSHSSPVIVSP